MHHALEFYNMGATIDQAVDDFCYHWDNPEVLDIKPTSWPKFSSFGSYREKGIKILREYHELLKWETREVVGCEHQFVVPFGPDMELTGTVDLLEVRKNAKGKELLRIVDYKTNAREPSLAQLHADIQFSTYVYASLQPEFWVSIGGQAAFERFKDVPRRAIWFHLQSCKEIDAGSRGEPEFERLYLAAKQIQRAIDLDVYVPNISGDSCTFCEFHQECGIKIPTREELDDDNEGWI